MAFDVPINVHLIPFGWNESTTVLHSKHTDSDVNNVQEGDNA